MVRRRLQIGLFAGLTLAAAGAITAQQAGQPGTAPKARGPVADHVFLEPGDLKWTDGPASLPPGVRVAVLEGDLASAGPITFRAKMPAGYQIPAHSHPQIEHVTVLSGELYMGAGDKLDKSKCEPLPRGGFAVMQAGTHHFAWTEVETEIQVHGVGPWGIDYVDPATDPRNKK